MIRPILHHRSGDLENQLPHQTFVLTLHHRSGDLENDEILILDNKKLHHRSGDLEISTGAKR